MRGRRPVGHTWRFGVGTALLLGALGNSPSAWAQAAAAASAPATTNPSDAAPSERAKRDADKVFHWILIQGDRTRKTGAAAGAKDERSAAAPKPAAAAAPVAAAPAPQMVRTAAREGAPESSTPAPATVRLKPDALASSAGGAAPSAKPAAAIVAPDKTEVAAAVAKPAEVADSAPKIDDSKPEPVAVQDDAPVGLVPIAQPEPQFALNTMRTLRRGTVQVKFTVQSDGSVADLEVLHTSSARLNAAALAAIGQWRFQPISKAVTGAVEVGFNLE